MSGDKRKKTDSDIVEDFFFNQPSHTIGQDQIDLQKISSNLRSKSIDNIEDEFAFPVSVSEEHDIQMGIDANIRQEEDDYSQHRIAKPFHKKLQELKDQNGSPFEKESTGSQGQDDSFDSFLSKHLQEREAKLQLEKDQQNSSTFQDTSDILQQNTVEPFSFGDQTNIFMRQDPFQFAQIDETVSELEASPSSIESDFEDDDPFQFAFQNADINPSSNLESFDNDAESDSFDFSAPTTQADFFEQDINIAKESIPKIEKTVVQDDLDWNTPIPDIPAQNENSLVGMATLVPPEPFVMFKWFPRSSSFFQYLQQNHFDLLSLTQSSDVHGESYLIEELFLLALALTEFQPYDESSMRLHYFEQMERMELEIPLPYTRLYADLFGKKKDKVSFIRILEMSAHLYAKQSSGEGYIELGTYLQSIQLEDLALKSYVQSVYFEPDSILAFQRIISICSQKYIHLPCDEWVFPKLDAEIVPDSVFSMNPFTLMFYSYYRLTQMKPMDILVYEQLQFHLLQVFSGLPSTNNQHYYDTVVQYIQHCNFDQNIYTYLFSIPILNYFDPQKFKRDFYQKIEDNAFGIFAAFETVKQTHDEYVPTYILSQNAGYQDIIILSDNLCVDQLDPIFIQNALHTLQQDQHQLSTFTTYEIWIRMVLSYGILSSHALIEPKWRETFADFGIQCTFELLQKHSDNLHLWNFFLEKYLKNPILPIQKLEALFSTLSESFDLYIDFIEYIQNIDRSYESILLLSSQQIFCGNWEDDASVHLKNYRSLDDFLFHEMIITRKGDYQRSLRFLYCQYSSVLQLPHTISQEQPFFCEHPLFRQQVQKNTEQQNIALIVILERMHRISKMTQHVELQVEIRNTIECLVDSCSSKALATIYWYVSNLDTLEAHLQRKNIDGMKHVFLRNSKIQLEIFQNESSQNQHVSYFFLQDGYLYPSTLEILQHSPQKWHTASTKSKNIYINHQQYEYLDPEWQKLEQLHRELIAQSLQQKTTHSYDLLSRIQKCFDLDSPLKLRDLWTEVYQNYKDHTPQKNLYDYISIHSPLEQKLFYVLLGGTLWQETKVFSYSDKIYFLELLTKIVNSDPEDETLLNIIEHIRFEEDPISCDKKRFDSFLQVSSYPESVSYYHMILGYIYETQKHFKNAVHHYIQTIQQQGTVGKSGMGLWNVLGNLSSSERLELVHELTPLLLMSSEEDSPKINILYFCYAMSIMSMEELHSFMEEITVSYLAQQPKTLSLFWSMVYCEHLPPVNEISLPFYERIIQMEQTIQSNHKVVQDIQKHYETYLYGINNDKSYQYFVQKLQFIQECLIDSEKISAPFESKIDEYVFPMIEYVRKNMCERNLFDTSDQLLQDWLVLLKKMGKKDDSIVRLQKEQLFSRVTQCMAVKQYDTAWDILQTALQDNPQDSEVRDLLIENLSIQGEWEKILQLLTEEYDICTQQRKIQILEKFISIYTYVFDEIDKGSALAQKLLLLEPTNFLALLVLLQSPTVDIQQRFVHLITVWNMLLTDPHHFDYERFVEITDGKEHFQHFDSNSFQYCVQQLLFWMEELIQLELFESHLVDDAICTLLGNTITRAKERKGTVYAMTDISMWSFPLLRLCISKKQLLSMILDIENICIEQTATQQNNSSNHIVFYTAAIDILQEHQSVILMEEHQNIQDTLESYQLSLFELEPQNLQLCTSLIDIFYNQKKWQHTNNFLQKWFRLQCQIYQYALEGDEQENKQEDIQVFHYVFHLCKYSKNTESNTDLFHSIVRNLRRWMTTMQQLIQEESQADTKQEETIQVHRDHFYLICKAMYICNPMDTEILSHVILCEIQNKKFQHLENLIQKCLDLGMTSVHGINLYELQCYCAFLKRDFQCISNVVTHQYQHDLAPSNQKQWLIETISIILFLQGKQLASIQQIQYLLQHQQGNAQVYKFGMLRMGVYLASIDQRTDAMKHVLNIFQIAQQDVCVNTILLLLYLRSHDIKQSLQCAQHIISFLTDTTDPFDIYLRSFCENIERIFSVPNARYVDFVEQFPSIEEIHSPSFFTDAIMYFYKNQVNIDRLSHIELSISHMFHIIIFEILKPIMLNEPVR